MAPANGPARPGKIQTVRIFLKHHNDPSGKYAPKMRTCETDPERGLVGCGGSIIRYTTFPKEKGMYFDGPPVVVQQFPVRQDGAVIAEVETGNVHFATCPKRKGAPTALPSTDGQQRSAGE